MGIRLLILLAVGLGALYTIHLLAQDFMKIRGTLSGGVKVFSEKKIQLKFKFSRQLQSFCSVNEMWTI